MIEISKRRLAFDRARLDLFEIDKAAPINRDLFDAYNFASQRGYRSLIDGADNWTKVNSPTLGPFGVTFNGSTQYATLTAARSVVTPPFTMMVVGSAAPTGNVLWSKLRNDSANWYGRYGIAQTISSAENSTFDGAATAVGVSGEKFYGFRCAVFVVTATRMIAAMNGRLGPADTAFTNPTTTNAANAMGAAVRSMVDNYTAGTMTKWFEWSRAMPDEEARWLSANPLAVYRGGGARSVSIPVATFGILPRIQNEGLFVGSHL